VGYKLSGLIKVNWNVVVNKNNGCIGIEIIARNSVGCFLRVRSSTQKIVVDSKLAEVIATLSALMFSKDVGFFDVIFESDALLIVQEVNVGTSPMNRIGHFVDNIKQGLSLFRSSCVVHVGREANLAAHALAREAATHVIDYV
jgi:ribonuclease HI